MRLNSESISKQNTASVFVTSEAIWTVTQQLFEYTKDVKITKSDGCMHVKWEQGGDVCWLETTELESLVIYNRGKR